MCWRRLLYIQLYSQKIKHSVIQSEDYTFSYTVIRLYIQLYSHKIIHSVIQSEDYTFSVFDKVDNLVLRYSKAVSRLAFFS